MKTIMKKTGDFFEDIFKDKRKKITFILFLILPFAVNIFIEIFNRRSFFKCLQFVFTSPVVFLNNVLIIYLTMSVVLLFKKRIFLMSLISIVWSGFGVTNFVLRTFRETPFSASDLGLIENAITIADKYLNLGIIILIIAVVIFIAAFIVFLWIKSPKYAEKINYVRNMIFIGVIAGVTALSLNVSIAVGQLSFKFSNLTEAYFQYGFVYCFSNSLVNTGIKRPADYSDDSIESLLNKINSSKTVDSNNIKTPNIIFLQLESFFDVSAIKDIEVSKDPIPNFNKLKEDFPSGYLSVNNVGYGTANTEFEVITGMNLDDFGPGEFPFKTILTTTTCESIAYNLRENGYTSHAMHNNLATFYSRNEIFAQLGFSDYIAIESMYIDEFTELGWAKDKFLTDEIIKVLDSTANQDFIYTISVQGHGSYPSTQVIENPKIDVTGPDDEREYSYEYYINQIHEMDMFIGELVAEIGERDEDTIIVMYGDHLPSLGLAEEDITNGDLYQTEYIIWNNMGLDIEDEDIETFQLASRVLESINIDTGIINKYHQVFKHDKDYLKNLHTLEFDVLYGDRYVYGGINPYVATDLVIGINEQSIDEVKEYKDDKEYYVIIEGDNFTTYCNAFINNVMYQTEYINENALRVYCDELKNLDSIVVKLMNDEKILRVSGEYLYIK